MRNTAYLLGLVLIAAGAVIAFPAFLDWIYLITSGSAFNDRGFSSQVEPTFVRFVIGAIIMGAGQGLWKIASSRGSNSTTYNNQKYNREHNINTNYHRDVQMGDQYHVSGQAGAVGPNTHTI